MNKNLNNEITAVVPFLNEEKYIEESVLRLINTNLFKNIILVNDNSTDRSREIAQSLCSKFDYIELINLDMQKGKGNAIKIALKKVNTTHLIVHDADLEYFPTDVIDMFEVAKNNPHTLVLGSRTIGEKTRNNKYKILL